MSLKGKLRLLDVDPSFPHLRHRSFKMKRLGLFLKLIINTNVHVKSLEILIIRFRCFYVVSIESPLTKASIANDTSKNTETQRFSVKSVTDV